MISAVIPVWNGREMLARLLDTLAGQPVAEVLVVDNGSSDGAAELAEARGARVMRMGGNAGFAPAVNRGIGVARADWIAVLNSDVELGPDYLSRLLATEGWFATGKLLRPGSAVLDGTWDLVARSGCAWRAGAGREDSAEFSVRRRIHCAPATAAIFRRALFEKVGLFDEAFESYLEDAEFGLRCALAGCWGEYIPQAVAWHRGSATLGRWHPETVRRLSRNQLLLVAKHLRRRFAWPVLAGQGLWGLVALRHGAGFAWLRGKAEGLGGLRRYPRCAADAAPLMAESEREVWQLQCKLGFDAYWRLYFALAPGAK